MKRRNERKGLTPIIAIVMLLMMTVAAGGLAWMFMSRVMEDQQSQVLGALSSRDKASRAQISIVNVAGEEVDDGHLNVGDGTDSDNGETGEDYVIMIKNIGSYTFVYSDSEGRLAEENQFLILIDGKSVKVQDPDDITTYINYCNVTASSASGDNFAPGDIVTCKTSWDFPTVTSGSKSELVKVIPAVGNPVSYNCEVYGDRKYC